VEAWLTEHGIDYKAEAYHAGTKYVLKECPFNPEHGKDKPSVFALPDGRIGFKCFHNSCSGNHWKEFRLHFEPDAYDHTYSQKDGKLFEWGEPLPFETYTEKPFQDFPSGVFPLEMERWLDSEMLYLQRDRLNIAVSALAVLAASLQGKAWVEHPAGNKHKEHLALFLAVIGESGTRKSSCFSEAMKPMTA